MDSTNPSSIPPTAAPITAPLRTNVTGSDKIWAIFSHLSAYIGLPFLLPLVVYLVMKTESEYVAINAKEALNFHLSLLIYTLCLLPLAFLLLGIPLLVIMWLAALVLSIIAAIKAADAGCYRYPVTIRLIK